MALLAVTCWIYLGGVSSLHIFVGSGVVL